MGSRKAGLTDLYPGGAPAMSFSARRGSLLHETFRRFATARK
jgi:hypothetical protein